MSTAIDWCVVGNGPELSSVLPRADYTIGFNQLLRPPFNVIVHNHKEKGLAKTIGVQSDESDKHLLSHLVETASVLETELGCWPSLGLTVITTGVKLQLKLSVHRMDLLPSLARSTDLKPNMPLAASFHNWLAERRYAFNLLAELDWPQLDVVSVSEPDLSVNDKSNCLRELIGLPSLNKIQARVCINWLCDLPFTIWIEAVRSANTADIIACDALFILSRTCCYTDNWWLYDVDYSFKMDQIRTRLAHAQAYCYSTKVFLC